MHKLILGMTNSGKTFLARGLCQRLQENGIETIVLNPFFKISAARWGASFETDSEREFSNVYFKSRNCAVFIDEAGSFCGRGISKKMLETATMGRHLGHVNYYIAQRGSQINMTVREQCSELFLFRQGVKDSALWAEEFANETLKKACELKHHEFFYAKKDGSEIKKFITDKEKIFKTA